MGKRLFDIVVASLCLVLFSPAMVAVALGVKLTSRGPVVISTIRVGRGGKLFSHYRFRTMEAQVPSGQDGERGRSGGRGNGTSSVRRDVPLRKTPFGRIIGNLSLDDVPTLINVLKGDLSIVGPRPEVPEKVDLNSEEWRKVLSVRPGLVSPAMLTYLDTYNSTSVSDRIEPELCYVENQTLLLDLKLMGRAVYWLARTGHLKGRF